MLTSDHHKRRRAVTEPRNLHLLNELERAGIKGVKTEKLIACHNVLEIFLKTRVLPQDLDIIQFTRDTCRIWMQQPVPKRKARTVRSITHIFHKQGFNSAYHRLSGRLQLDEFQSSIMLSICLLDWHADGSPYPGYDKESVAALAEYVSNAGVNIHKVKIRIAQEGLTEQDLLYLIEVIRTLGRPVRLREIIPALKTRKETD